MTAHQSSLTTANRTPPTRCMSSRLRRFPAAARRTFGSAIGAPSTTLSDRDTRFYVSMRTRLAKELSAQPQKGVFHSQSSTLTLLKPGNPVRNLTLIRPDQHVAWRGDAEPADPLAVIDLLRGAPITRNDLPVGTSVLTNLGIIVCAGNFVGFARRESRRSVRQIGMSGSGPEPDLGGPIEFFKASGRVGGTASAAARH